MRSLSDTVERLARLRSATTPSTSGSRLTKISDFGSNPGALSGYVYRPASADPKPPLVVVLHGCTQTAAGYDAGSGWSKLADDYGFVLLFPEQPSSNNPNRCFNWFNTEDISRDRGEVLSISQMIAAAAAAHNVDDRRVFITGLSAGGAMANAMLACYPDLFAAGAIIAGLPHGVATSVPQAFDRMRGHGLVESDALQALLADAADHDGPWPTISVWHGTGDRTVLPVNAHAIVDQWRGVHGAAAEPSVIEDVDAQTRMVWLDKDGQPSITFHSIAGMAHGTPIDAVSGYGDPAPFMLDIGISSTLQIARSWGIAASFERREKKADTDRPYETPGPATARSPRPRSSPKSSPGPAETGIQSVIEKALRAAGLMR